MDIIDLAKTFVWDIPQQNQKKVLRKSRASRRLEPDCILHVKRQPIVTVTLSAPASHTLNE
jgi:hypothetical protein